MSELSFLKNILAVTATWFSCLVLLGKNDWSFDTLRKADSYYIEHPGAIMIGIRDID